MSLALGIAPQLANAAGATNATGATDAMAQAGLVLIVFQPRTRAASQRLSQEIESLGFSVKLLPDAETSALLDRLAAESEAMAAIRVKPLDAGGVEIVGASASPSTTNVMTGVVIVGGAEVSARLGEAGFEDLQTALRVYIPGTETVSARVEVIPEDGSTTGTEFAIDVQGGVAADLPIDSLPDGSYTVRVETDVPAVAAVRTATLGGVDGSSATV